MNIKPYTNVRESLPIVSQKLEIIRTSLEENVKIKQAMKAKYDMSYIDTSRNDSHLKETLSDLENRASKFKKTNKFRSFNCDL